MHLLCSLFIFPKIYKKYKKVFFCDERKIILYDSWVHQHVTKHSGLQNSTHAVNSTTQNLTC
jgi:hypothetical protein